MSKELEALRQLHMAGAYVSESLRNKITPSKATELKNVVYQAIKRNEPMKPALDEDSNFRCARCHHIVDNHYCSDCGGAVDWSDEK